MPSVGQIEKKTQERALALPSQRLGYTYLGDWIDRPANSNIEPGGLKAWLLCPTHQREAHYGSPQVAK